MSDLKYSDVQSILKIIDEAEHLNEIELVLGDFRLHVVRDGAGGASAPIARAAPAAPATRAPAQAAPKAPPAAAAKSGGGAARAVPEGLVAVRAPMLGTFYRAPAPGEKPFVEIGQKVKADDTVCLIEVMKLFNSIRAGVDGRIVDILAENAGLVEYNEPIILIEPKG